MSGQKEEGETMKDMSIMMRCLSCGALAALFGQTMTYH